MARLRPAIRKDHRPGDVADAAPKLAIDEIREPPEEEADRHHRRDRVVEGEHRKPARAGEKRHREHAADQPAMEGHAAAPDGEDLRGVLEIEVEIVEQHIGDASAEHDAERRIDDEIVDIGRRRMRHARPRAGRR